MPMAGLIEVGPRIDPAADRARRAVAARGASGRRRLVDPTTCERDYSDDEVEFLRAIEDYRHAHARPFPTWTEVLGVLRGLGYVKPEGGAA